MKQKVFLSYAHEDMAFVKAITDKLPEILQIDPNNLEVIDSQTNVNVGEDLRSKIKRDMEGAGSVVIFSSPHSEKSQWVSYEAGMAEALGKNVLIVGQKRLGKTSLLHRLTNKVRIIDVE